MKLLEFPVKPMLSHWVLLPVHAILDIPPPIKFPRHFDGSWRDQGRGGMPNPTFTLNLPLDL